MWKLKQDTMNLSMNTNRYTETIKKKKLPGFPGGSDGKASACNMEDPCWIPGLGRSPGEGNYKVESLEFNWPCYLLAE